MTSTLPRPSIVSTPLADCRCPTGYPAWPGQYGTSFGVHTADAIHTPYATATTILHIYLTFSPTVPAREVTALLAHATAHRAPDTPSLGRWLRELFLVATLTDYDRAVVLRDYLTSLKIHHLPSGSAGTHFLSTLHRALTLRTNVPHGTGHTHETRLFSRRLWVRMTSAAVALHSPPVILSASWDPPTLA